MIVRAGYIPQIPQEEIVYETLTYGEDGQEIKVEVPRLSIEQFDYLAERVKRASEDMRRTMSVSELVETIDRVIQRLLDRNDDYRQRAELYLPKVTGYDSEMIRLGLTSYFQTFRRNELLRFLAEDFGNPALLDSFQPAIKGGLTKAVGPSLATHIWAGNYPGLPLWSMLTNLLVKGGTIGKVATAEPLFAGWVAELIAEENPRLAETMAIVWWRGGEEEIERRLFAHSELVFAYGSNTSLQSIQSRVPVTAKFLSFGHKLGVAYIAKEALNAKNAREVARSAAYDCMRYDQQGCYSPQFLFVQTGGRVVPEHFAEYVANELKAFETRFPRRMLSMEEQAAMQAWKRKEEMSKFTVKGKKVMGDPDGSWTVTFEPSLTQLEPTPLDRAMRIIEVQELDEVLPQLAALRPFLQTAAVAASPEDLPVVSEKLAELGVTRITAVGSMTAPEAGWHHDGTSSLRDLVRFVDIERNAEAGAEQFSSYRD